MRPVFMLVSSLLFSTALTGCGGGGAADGGSSAGGGDGRTLSAAYLPLSVGYRWAYRSKSDHGLRMQVVRSGEVGGEATVWTAQGFDGKAISSQRIEANASVLRVIPDDSNPLSRAIGPYDVLRFPMATGSVFTQVDKGFPLDMNGDGRMDDVRVKSTVTLVGFETRPTPLGSFDGAAHLRTSMSINVAVAGGGNAVVTSVVDEWYVEGIGLVETSGSVDSGGVSTDLSQSLIAYRSAVGSSEDIAPSVVSMSPAQGSRRGGSAAFRVAFDESMDPISLLSASVEVRDASGGLVPGKLQATEHTLAFVPDSFQSRGQFEIRIGTAMTDLAGNPVSLPDWRFTIDPDAPNYASISPSDNAQDVALNATLQFSLDDYPDPSTVDELSVVLTGPSGNLPLDISVDGRTVTVRPSVPLERIQSYSLTVNGGNRIADRDGNLLGRGFSIGFATDGGMFAAHRLLPTASIVEASVTGDLDGDGVVDIVQLGGDDQHSSYSLYRITRGSSGDYVRTLVTTGLMDVDGEVCAMNHQFVLYDLDGDGRSELIRSGCSGIEIGSLDATGRWQRNAIIGTRPARRILVADFDRDGHPDIIVGRSNDVQVWKLQGVPTPTQIAGVDFADPFFDIAAGDFDGDGRTDIAVSLPTRDYLGGGVYWRLQQADGSFGPIQRRVGHEAEGARYLAIGDFNGDGRTDLIASTGGNSPTYLALYLQTADGTLGEMTRVPTHDIPEEIRVGDLNADGLDDVVVRHHGWGTVGVYIQAGGGASLTELLFPYPTYTYGLALGDLDGDGMIDIVVGQGFLRQKRP